LPGSSIGLNVLVIRSLMRLIKFGVKAANDTLRRQLMSSFSK